MTRTRLILLNGATSAGKTSLAAALQARLPGVWLNASIDDFIKMMPPGLRNDPEGIRVVSDEHAGTVALAFGPSGFKMIQAFHRAVAAMAATGRIIVDHVMFDPRFWPDWQEALGALPRLTVGVHCDLPELERRERERGDRMIGQARAQINLVHRAPQYDLEVDTSRDSNADCAQKILDLIAARL
ncbi:AAA family ATPase [Pacificimonas sp. WHA3]|uniref:AAA family ATPase n=1 Tax=Pacificimonas pallii TaxID=2827236 RepID=A0ABS6SG80_9SPHN|nr:AAA family ATPase [Pacificimonas pallii]MBV7257265.1 AAA family ATPase [Pacificimonas pallii]